MNVAWIVNPDDDYSGSNVCGIKKVLAESTVVLKQCFLLPKDWVEVVVQHDIPVDNSNRGTKEDTLHRSCR